MKALSRALSSNRCGGGKPVCPTHRFKHTLLVYVQGFTGGHTEGTRTASNETKEDGTTRVTIEA